MWFKKNMGIVAWEEALTCCADHRLEDFLALLIGAPLAEQAAELERLELAKQRNKAR